MMEMDIMQFSHTERAGRVIVALDCAHDEALAIASTLAGHAEWLKVGMTLFYACGPAIVAELKEMGFKVFIDLKLHDIPAQVHGAVRSLAGLDADMLTLHASGGAEMMRQAVLAADEAKKTSGTRPIVIGVTVLTSMGEDALAETGVAASPDAQVERLASLASASGLDGVVCSPLEAASMRALLGSEAAIVTPGVRLDTHATDDQTRIATPRAAFDSGASYVVVGRPVTRADNPLSAFEEIAATL